MNAYVCEVCGQVVLGMDHCSVCSSKNIVEKTFVPEESYIDMMIKIGQTLHHVNN